MCVCMCVCMYVCMYVCVCMCVYIYVCIYMCMCVYICMCMHICVNIYIHKYLLLLIREGRCLAWDFYIASFAPFPFGPVDIVLIILK